MKGIVIAILFILAALSGANASRVNVADVASSTKNPSWWIPRWWWPYHPIPPRWGWPSPPLPSPPRIPGWGWPFHPIPPSSSPSKLSVDSNNQKSLFDPNIFKCLGDLASGATSCFQQISESYDAQTISLSPTCCTAVQQLNADCSSTVFSIFNNPFFQYAVKQCSATP